MPAYAVEHLAPEGVRKKDLEKVLPIMAFCLDCVMTGGYDRSMIASNESPAPIEDRMLAAHRRRMIEMPTAIIIPKKADRSIPRRNRNHSVSHRAISTRA